MLVDCFKLSALVISEDLRRHVCVHCWWNH